MSDSQSWAVHQQALQQAKSLAAMVMVVLQMLKLLGQGLLNAELARRSQQPTAWPNCPTCGSRLRSKGKRPRQIQTVLGVLHYTRQVGRCPNHCSGSQRIPLDEQLQIKAYSQTAGQLKYWATLLSLFVPYELASHLLKEVSGVSVSPQSIWNWVQQLGAQLQAQQAQQLSRQAAGEPVPQEPVAAIWQALTLVIAADGVMVPLRPTPGTPKGKTVWQEVKVGVMARLERWTTQRGHVATRLRQRRLVAVLGSIDAFQPRLLWEALHQGLTQASKVVWLSDGGVGFWRLFREGFAPYAVGILDFYHAAGHLWRAARALLGGDTEAATDCFERWRHLLRHGQQHWVLQDLKTSLTLNRLSKNDQQTLQQVVDYFQTHAEHIAYGDFEAQQLPLGSGLVESACKWLIQQRFKGVGMRWSESGFNHLLELRLAWVNQRFDDLFPHLQEVRQMYSPNP